MVLVGASVLGWFVLWSLEAQLDGSHVVWSCLSLLGALYCHWAQPGGCCRAGVVRLYCCLSLFGHASKLYLLIVIFEV